MADYEKELDEVMEILRLLGDKTRLTIYSLLKVKELCVCEITDILNISQPAVSQHLRKLKLLNLAKERKDGKWVYYSLRTPSEEQKMLKAIITNLPDLSVLLKKFNNRDICKL